MTRADDLLNLILGACAVGYSFVPPHRLPRYHRGLALVLRAGGVLLLMVAGTSLALDRWSSVRHGTLTKDSHGRSQRVGAQ